MSILKVQRQSGDILMEQCHAGVKRLALLLDSLFWLDLAKQQSLLAAILTGGHVLIEDHPGTGKTTLAKYLASLLGLSFSRIQFTSDLLPADIAGMMVLDPKTREYTFRQGPLFANLVLADELNRASGRTQSALLEAMAEGSVTIDRVTFELPQPYIVIATENDGQNVGTFAIPESQLDRFSLKLEIGYPPQERESSILQAGGGLDQTKAEALLSASQLARLQGEIKQIFLSQEVANYVSLILHRTRTDPRFVLGASTRAGISWVSIARGIAYQQNRSFVMPDDLISCAHFCLTHRLKVKQLDAKSALLDILHTTPIP